MAKMRLLHIVLLFSYLSLGSANQDSTDEADCDDPTVFRAADEVLKSLNDVKEDGNQFVLYRITEAMKKEETGRVNVFIKFKIQESVCPVKNGIYWQRCAFKEIEAEYGECSANVLINTETKSEEIISQNCSTKGWQPKAPKLPVVEPTVKVVYRSRLGTFQAIDTNSEILLPILQSAIEKMNREGNHKFHFDLENVTLAEQQVVSGWNYKLEYEIRQTNCSKSFIPIWTPTECSLDKSGQGGRCTAEVFVTPYEEINDIRLDCYSSTGFCLSCPDRVENNDPELLDLLKQFIEEYNSNSNHTNYYKVQSVQTASRKLIQSKKQYTVTFRIQETNCTKSDHSILGDRCDIEPTSNDLSCKANVNVTDETVNILPGYNCDSLLLGASSNDGRSVIKGLSPLRMAPSFGKSVRRISRSPEKSKWKGHEPDHKEQKHGKKQKKDKGKEDKKHHGKHDHSSEESEEEHKHKPQVLPRPPQHIPPVPEIVTSVLLATTQKVNPTSVDNVHGPPLTQPPSPLIPNHSQSFPLTTAVPAHQGTYPHIHETVILERPVLVPEIVPKCPGKLWQPLLPNLQIVTEKTFVIGGLALKDDDLLL